MTESQGLTQEEVDTGSESRDTGEDPTWAQSQKNRPRLSEVMERTMDLRTLAKEGYTTDPTFVKVIIALKEFPAFEYRDRLL